MSRSRRALRLLLIVLLASPLLLWLAANAFINVGLEPVLNGKPDKIRIRTSFAWMWLPGQVSIRGLEIRGQGKNDQWLITVDQATADVDLRALTERTFRASNVKAKGGGFRYRFRATEPVNPANDGTPPIVGLTNPPNPIPDPAKGKKGPFTIDLQGVEVDDVRELWVEDYHYVGSAHVVGDVKLGDEISLAGHLTMPTGQMLRGKDEAMVETLTGEAGGSLSGIVRGEPITRDVLANLDATADIKAQAENLSFVNYYLQAAPWLKLDGRAELAVDVDIVDGAWALGSLITAHTTDMTVDFFAYEIRGDGTVRLEVVTGNEGPETHMGVNYGQFTIHEIAAEAAPTVDPVAPENAPAPAPDADAKEVAKSAPAADAGAVEAAVEPLVVGNGFQLTAVSPDTQIGKPLMNMNVLVEIPESTIADVKRFDRYMPTGAGLSIVGGSGGLAGRFEASTSTGRLAGAVDITGDDVAVTFDGLLITTNLGLHAQLAGGDVGKGVYDFSGTSVSITQLGMHDMDPEKARDEEGMPRDWWAKITVTEGAVTMGAQPFLDARIAMQCANSEPFVKVIAQKKKLPGWVQNALDMPNVQGYAHVQMGDDTIVLNPLNITGGKQLEVKMRLFRKGTANTGAMYARFGSLSAAVDMDPGDTDVHVFDAKDWYAGDNVDKDVVKDVKAEEKKTKKEEKAEKKAERKTGKG